ncbi:hypothetical protein KAT95_01445 [Candidatus Parcubacteria bacterium]|nr:hypothetical protein [Candidatus Parcubacteria bacterium]
MKGKKDRKEIKNRGAEIAPEVLNAMGNLFSHISDVVKLEIKKGGRVVEIWYGEELICTKNKDDNNVEVDETVVKWTDIDGDILLDRKSGNWTKIPNSQKLK